MPDEQTLTFPLRGFNAAGAYSRQPEATTPACLNVRARPALGGRLRGGSRAGLAPAYETPLAGGQPLQWLGWLDYGFGDRQTYTEAFDGEDGPLDGRAAWSADADLEVRAGAARVLHAAGDLPITDAEASYNAFAGDTWNDFELTAEVAWRYGTSASLELWVSTGLPGAVGGASVTLTYESRPVPAPGNGFQSSLAIELASGGQTARWARQYGALYTQLGGEVRLQADRNHVRLLWQGRPILSVPRNDGLCAAAGFAMSLSNPVTDGWLPDDLVDVALQRWSLTAVTRATTPSRRLVAVADGAVYLQNASGSLPSTPVDSDRLAGVPLVAAAHCQGHLFLLDGSAGWQLNPMVTANPLTVWTVRGAGAVPAATGIVNWRNRLVLFGLPDRPGEYLMTRQGDPWDLDVSAGDARAAVAGELSEAAAIGDPITAVCPWGSDLLVATSRSLWRLHGDPAQGGYASQLSRHVGLLGPTAWCTGGDGRLYFLAAQGAVALDPSGRLEELSGHRVPQLAGRAAVTPGRSAAAGETHVAMAYDAQRNGVLVLLAERSGGQGEGWFYDVQQDAWFPDSYAEAFGPMCATWYNATDADERRLLLGGRNGRLYAFDDAAASDEVDGLTDHAIDSRVTFAPLTPAPPAGDATLTELHATLAETTDAVTYALAAADSAEAALAADADQTGQWTAGANRPARSRLRGRAFALTLTGPSSGGQWALEHLSARFAHGGPAR